MRDHDDTLIRIETKLDKVADKIQTIEVVLSKQHVVLADHIRRTELLEEGMKPLQTHVAMVHGALKLIGILGIIAAIIEGVMALVKH